MADLTRPYDVLVIGGGNAALCAAITAREAGARVLLVEHAPRAMRGGNSRHTRNLRCMHDAPQDVLVDAYPEEEYWQDILKVTGGRTDEGLDGLAWCRRAAELGAGEILLTSMDRDGTGAGYDTALLAEVAAAVSIPVIASGGVGTLAHLAEGLEAGAEAVLAATIFHFGQHTIGQAKDPDEREQRKETGRQLRERKDSVQAEIDRLDKQAHAIQATIPNLTHAAAPLGGEHDSREVKRGTAAIRIRSSSSVALSR